MKTIFFVVSALTLFGIGSCKDPSDGTGTLPEAPFIEGGVSFILSPDKLDIEITITSVDGSAVRVEGCKETTITSGAKAELHAQGARITLKGNITELKCDNNQLRALNVQGLAALESLECFNNRLTALNVQGLPALQELECRNNELTALNLRGMTALQGLWCGGNKLAALNVRDLTALQTLRCNDNQFETLDVHGLSALKNLYCKNNKLTALNVEGCAALQELECDGNKLTALDVHGLTSLQELHCYNNLLAALNVEGCTALKGVDCLSNKLDAQAFTKLFSDLPQSTFYAHCYLYTEENGVAEGNHKDFTSASAPAELKRAFEKLKNEKKWTLYKIRADKRMVEI